ncbi:MAG: DUF4886 domain-containing protein [Bacteroidota bacterium]
MKKLVTSLALIVLVTLSADTARATTRKVLFIGNSYIYSNSMPAMLQALATACGDTLIFDTAVPGGYTFQQHSTDATTISKIFSQQWDIVVLQEQSQRPSFPPAQVATDVYPYAERLDSLVHANDTCTQTMFLMTWGRRNGDALNCPGYPAVCTYAGMQARLRESYMEMTIDNDAIVAPAGPAFKVIIDSFPAIDLYQADSSHPSLAGSYIEACVLYSSIFHKRTMGSSYTGGLAAGTVQTLQRIADKVAMDSLAQWQVHGHYPYADFAYTQSGTAVTFTNQSAHATGYEWRFGDATTGSTLNPIHTYPGNGTYIVTLTAQTDCFTEVRKDTIQIGPVSVAAGEDAPPAVYVSNEGYGNVTFHMPPATAATLEIFDSKGSKVASYAVTGSDVACRLAPGFYVYRATFPATGKVVYGKVMP